MEHLHFGVPTPTRTSGLTPAVSARNPRLSCADLTGRTPADQWVVLKRVRALVPYDNADHRPLEPADTIAVSWSTRAAGPSGPKPPGAVAS